MIMNTLQSEEKELMGLGVVIKDLSYIFQHFLPWKEEKILDWPKSSFEQTF